MPSDPSAPPAGTPREALAELVAAMRTNNVNRRDDAMLAADAALATGPPAGTPREAVARWLHRYWCSAKGYDPTLRVTLADTQFYADADALLAVVHWPYPPEVWREHVPCTNEMHDPASGLLAGFCVRCRVPWPCSVSPESVAAVPPAATPGQREWFCECEHAIEDHDMQTGECNVVRSGRPCICDNPTVLAAAPPRAPGERERLLDRIGYLSEKRWATPEAAVEALKMVAEILPALRAAPPARRWRSGSLPRRQDGIGRQ